MFEVTIRGGGKTIGAFFVIFVEGIVDDGNLAKRDVVFVVNKALRGLGHGDNFVGEK